MEVRLSIKYALRIFAIFALIVTNVSEDLYCLMIPCLNKVILLYGYFPGLWIEQSGFELWLRHCIVFLRKTLYSDSQCLSSPRHKNGYQQI